jgi:hypothetical protein
VIGTDELRARVAALRERIAAAGADPESVTLVAVTKGFDPEVVTLARDVGLVDLGENYAQELAAKADRAPDARWHFIGRLQRNKVRSIAHLVHLWQSVDRLATGEEIARRAPGARVLVQVNATGEPDKGGCPPALAAGLVEGLGDLGLDVRGLMVVGPTSAEPGATAAAFGTVRQLADELGLPERSMGMTGDLELAVREGSTMVRVGTALFGARPVHNP